MSLNDWWRKLQPHSLRAFTFVVLVLTLPVFLMLTLDPAKLRGLLGEDGVTLFVTAFSIIAAVVVTVQTYLQHGAADASAAAAEQVRELSARTATAVQGPDTAQLAAAVTALNQRVDTLASPFTNEQRAELANAAAKLIVSSAVDAKLEQVARGLADAFDRRHIIEALERNSVVTLARLNGAIPDLSKRANLNLAIGIATTMVGVTVLAFAVFNSPGPNSDAEALSYLAHFAPRLSLAILIEIFAYFFLRLYKDNLEAVRAFQNDMTTIEVTRTALATVVLAGDISAAAQIATEIATPDRNKSLPNASSSVAAADTKSVVTLLQEAISLMQAKK